MQIEFTIISLDFTPSFLSSVLNSDTWKHMTDILKYMTGILCKLKFWCWETKLPYLTVTDTQYPNPKSVWFLKGAFFRTKEES